MKNQMVAVVAGATRGAGRGIARGIGETGAMVYCTGRSVRGNASAYNRPETIEETAEMITAAGGTAKHAAPPMIEKRRGLIVEVTESDTLIAGGNILAQIVKLSQKALAAIWAAELRKHGVAAVAITPGFLRSERMLENFGVTEENWRDGGKKDKNFLASESPLFVGRAVAALAQDPRILEQSGQLLSSWEIGRKYGCTDRDGSRPDWGAVDVDYSQVPAPVLEAILDAAQVQTEWLRVLSARTERFRNSLLTGTMGELDSSGSIS